MRLLPSLAFLLLPVAAQAACPGDTQVEMNACAEADFKAADAELNAAWKPAKAFYDGTGHGEDLLKAQRAWIAFRDANCWAEAAPYTTGSIQPLVFSSCMARLTRQRTKDLTQMTGY